MHLLHNPLALCFILDRGQEGEPKGVYPPSDVGRKLSQARDQIHGFHLEPIVLEHLAVRLGARKEPWIVLFGVVATLTESGVESATNLGAVHEPAALKVRAE